MQQYKQEHYNIFAVNSAAPLPLAKQAWNAPLAAYHSLAEVLSSGAAAGKSAAEARKRATERAQREAADDPDLAAALAASMADVDDSGRGGGGSGGRKAPRPMEVEQDSEQAALKRAIALSLGSGSGAGGDGASGGGSSSSGGGGGVGGEAGGRPVAPLSALIGHLLQLQAATDTSAAEPAPGAPGVRVAVRLPPLAAPHASLAAPAEGSKLQVERCFSPDAPVSAVLAWAEAAWVRAWVGDAAIAAAAEAGVFEELEQPPPAFKLLCRGVAPLTRDTAGPLRDAGVTGDTVFHLQVL
jgi:hypothetical protein